ncbi:hypothetical protein [Mesorhizobium sp. A556]
MKPTQTIKKQAGIGKTESIIADDLLRQRAEARVRQMVSANLLIDWTRDFLLEHGPRVVTETKEVKE